MPAVVPPSRENPFSRFIAPMLVIAAFAGGYLLRGAGLPPGRAVTAPAGGDPGRYIGVVEEVRSDAVVVMAPDRPGPGALQHLVTLRVTTGTRINSLLGKGARPDQPPEEGGESATLPQIRKDDLVGFTGGSPYESSEFDVSTITIVSRPPPLGTP